MNPIYSGPSIGEIRRLIEESRSTGELSTSEYAELTNKLNAQATRIEGLLQTTRAALQRAEEMTQTVNAMRSAVATVQTQVGDARKRSPAGQPNWARCSALLLPKYMREPWFGDLCEERERMERTGASRAFIRAFTVSQILCVIGSGLLRLGFDMGRLFRP